MVGWIVGTIVVEVLIVAIGVFGSVSIPGLSTGESEAIVVRVAVDVLPTILGILLLCRRRGDHRVHRQQLSPDAREQPDAGRLSAVHQSPGDRSPDPALHPSARARAGRGGFIALKFFTTILQMALWAYTMYGAAITPALLAAFVWPRATRQGGIAAMVIGMVTTLGWEIVAKMRSIDGNPRTPSATKQSIPRSFSRSARSSSSAWRRRRRTKKTSRGSAERTRTKDQGPYHRRVRVLLISTYDLGRQPFGLASPAAWLRAEGVEVTCADLSRSSLPQEAVRAAALVAFFLPMHTATRMALPAIDRVRALNPSARLVAYGLYAPLNESLLRERGVETILGPEFEEESGRDDPEGSCHRDAGRATRPGRALPRIEFKTPDRSELPPLERYAKLQMPDGSKRVVGYTEGSRGCKHLCRHCPIVPVYQGRFRVIPVEIVLADIRAQVAAGAQHITFGDPDFFNGVTHALRIVRALASEHPGISYDVTIKVEHLIRHADALPELAATSCAFITSAVESIDDEVLARLAKGHTRADFERAVSLCRAAGVPLSPTFVAFTPWTTTQGYAELLDEIERLDLVDHVAPIQLAIRLLITAGSPLLELPEIREIAGPFNPRSLTHPWVHARSGSRPPAARDRAARRAARQRSAA